MDEPRSRKEIERELDRHKRNPPKHAPEDPAHGLACLQVELLLDIRDWRGRR